jgi:hypothetical protein
VLRPGDWPDSLTAALAALGCRLADLRLWQQHDGSLPAALSAFVQPPTASGVLDALAAARDASGGQPEGSPAEGQAGWWQAVAQLSVAGRRQLRGFLLQPKWCSADHLSVAQLRLLRSLPMFELHADELASQLAGASAGRPPAGQSPPSQVAPHFTALPRLGVAAQQLYLPPSCVAEPGQLGAHFLKPDSDVEAALLQGAYPHFWLLTCDAFDQLPMHLCVLLEA